MFVVKKIVSRLLFPVPVGLGLAFAGLALLWFTKRQRLGRALVALGLALLLLLSTAPVSGWLLRPLEDTYLPFGAQGTETVPTDQIAYVVVLAGGLTSYLEYPITRQVGARSIARLVEGVRVHQLCPNSKLVLSGGLGADLDAPRELLTNYRFVTLLGVRDEDILIENSSLDTEQEARNIKPIVGDAPFVLVTSASHMPRAVALFRRQGLQPIPAPADYRLGLRRIWMPESLLPSAPELANSTVAIYEYLGMAWARLRGLV